MAHRLKEAYIATKDVYQFPKGTIFIQHDFDKEIFFAILPPYKASSILITDRDLIRENPVRIKKIPV